VNGREISIPILRPSSAEDDDARRSAIVNKELRLLEAIANDPSATHRDLSAASGVSLGSLSRALSRLAREKLAYERLGKWAITRKGKETIKEHAKGEPVVAR
jgi:DNA-binding MarR family transcriptional regulator